MCVPHNSHQCMYMLVNAPSLLSSLPPSPFSLPLLPSSPLHVYLECNITEVAMYIYRLLVVCSKLLECFQYTPFLGFSMGAAT